MNNIKKTQTASEYMIILAIVIIIALIVVGVLGDVPSIGKGANENTKSINSKLGKDLTITNIINKSNENENSTELTFYNNGETMLTISEIVVGGETYKLVKQSLQE